MNVSSLGYLYSIPCCFCNFFCVVAREEAEKKSWSGVSEVTVANVGDRRKGSMTVAFPDFAATIVEPFND